MRCFICSYLRVTADDLSAEALSTSGYLEFKEKLDESHTDPWTLEIDLAPFNSNFPKMNRCSAGQMQSRPCCGCIRKL